MNNYICYCKRAVFKSIRCAFSMHAPCVDGLTVVRVLGYRLSLLLRRVLSTCMVPVLGGAFYEKSFNNIGMSDWWDRVIYK